MSESRILRPFNSLRDIYRPRTALIVAAEGCLEFPDDLKAFTEGSNGLNVHYAKRLPLPCGSNHPPIDLVVFVYKVFNQASLQVIRESMSYLDVRYLVGKCFILVYADSKYCLFDTREVDEFAERLHIPVHYANKQKASTAPNGKPRLHLPSELLSIYCPPVGSDVNSLIIDAALSHNAQHLT